VATNSPGPLALVLALFSLTLANASTNLTAWVPIFKGIDHAVGTNTPGGGGFPDLHVVHVLRVDLKDPDIRLFSSPRIKNYALGSRETPGYTVSDFLVTNQLQVAINAGLFDPSQYYLAAGTPMDITGLSICQGAIVSVQENSYCSAAIMFTTNNQATIIPTNWPPAPTAGIYTAVSGTYPLLINGTNIGYKYRGDPDDLHRLQPRTAYGLSQDKRYLYLLTIDGRQPGYSNGAYDYETGAWLLLVGAYDGINMDGGGSTTLVVQDSTGAPVVLNRSSAVADSGRQRTVGSHFGIFAKPVPGFINDVTAIPDDTTATITWTTMSPATSQVWYGPTPDMPLSTTLQSSLVTNHAVLLTDLAPATTYYFKTVSTTGGVEYASLSMAFVTSNYVTMAQIFDITHSWTYSTANLDGVAWTTRSYNDSAWNGSGPGLLWVDVRATGPNPEVDPKNTQMPADPNNSGYPYITYYFRTRFAFTNSLAGVSLMFSCYVDDGAVFYLNGTEIYRLNMDPAPTPIYSRTLATSYSCDGNATCPNDFTISGELTTNLVVGDNVLAVEVHNYNRLSPDTTFGTALAFTEPHTISPALSISSTPGTVTLSWSRGGFILQQASSSLGPWTDVPGPVVSSPYTAAVSDAARYYRLRK
jgi:hypothetical protein